MDFAKKQLEKYGWKEGHGLGRYEDGISEALKPKLKFDNTGIGHSAGEQFTNNWWERVFNNASKNINVQIDDEGVKLERCSKDSVEISTKNYSVKELKKNKNLQYGSFLKTSKLTESGVEHYNVIVPEPLAVCNSLTDEELFAACGGRTAHKGARHGLKLSGKLSRIERQEKMLLKKMKNVTITDDTNNLQKKLKKLKKRRGDETSNHINEATTSNSGKKKNKKKRKSVSFSEEPLVKYYTPDLDSRYSSSSRDENSNESLNELVVLDPNSNVFDEGIEQDIDNDNNSEQNDTHKSFEELQTNFSDLSKAERKKLKKKRKLEKKDRATGKFIEEVLEEISNEEIGKKRKLVVDDDHHHGDQIQNLDKYTYCKKKKSVPEKFEKNKKEKKEKKEKREKKRETKMMKSIVESMDHFCKISDDE